ncbi:MULTISPECIES: IclR family transcriptional regulator [unclassified Aeribacillus]|uniref:IclR family transcriptional regulator n=1 Tax=unclassified Aeribacillus TaxID=2640495 RepID=UPI0030D600C1
MSEKYWLSSVKNAMKILRLFTHKQKELGITEISKKLNISKSSAHRLVSLLVKEGFLSKNPRTNKYRLGLSILTLGGVIFSNHELYKEALPIVKRLVHTLNESAHICLLEEDQVVYLFRIESSQPDRLLTYIGRKNPIHCTSEGLCILAYQNKRTIEKVLSKKLYAYTPYTITDPDILKNELKKIKKQGFAISKDQFYVGYVGIAAPIRDYSGKVVSSLSMIGSTSRMTDDRFPVFIEHITQAAKSISEHLGYIDGK